MYRDIKLIFMFLLAFLNQLIDVIYSLSLVPISVCNKETGLVLLTQLNKA